MSINTYGTRILLTLTPDVSEYIKSRKDLEQGIRAELAGYTPNKTEEIGEKMLFPITGIPKFLGYLKNPAAQVVAVTTVMVVGVFFLFYPLFMKDLVEKGFKLVANAILSYPEYAKIGGVFTSIYTFIGWGVRAYGRFSNDKMQKAFAVDQKEKAAP